MLKALKRNHEITYVCLDDGRAPESAARLAAEYCTTLVRVPFKSATRLSPRFYYELVNNIFSRLPYSIARYVWPALRHEIVDAVRTRRVDVLVCDFLAPAANVPPELPVGTVLFQHNVEAAIWRRHFEVETRLHRKVYFWEQWRRMRAFEAATCRLYDAVVAVSRTDCNTMAREYGLRHVFEVSTGVDTTYFSPVQHSDSSALNIVFTGSMDWLPNEDGIRYFLRDILPLVRSQRPDATFTVVGRAPPRWLTEEARRDASLTVTGFVEDVRPYMAGGAVYVVPLRIGGGTRLKVFEAMAMEKPIVSTTIGAEGLPVNHQDELLIADTPDAFAESILRLAEDRGFAKEMAGRARTRVVADFSWLSVATQFSQLLESVVRRTAVNGRTSAGAGRI